MKVRVITHTNIIFESDDASLLTVPTVEGIIQILPEHQNLVANLDLGKLVIKSKDNEDKVILLAGGVIDVKSNEVTILADYADLPESLVQEQIQQSIDLAQQKISTSTLPASELIQLEKILRYERFKQQNV
jgi:F-type H+-transporting ATPase subunit epsilon